MPDDWKTKQELVALTREAGRNFQQRDLCRGEKSRTPDIALLLSTIYSLQAIDSSVSHFRECQQLSLNRNGTKPSKNRRRRFEISRLSDFTFYAALSLPPLFFGSREPPVVAAWCILLGIGLIAASPQRLTRQHLMTLGVVTFVALCLLFVVYQQMADHSWLAPPNPLWAKASETLAAPLSGSVSILRDEPYYALGTALANLMALALSVVVGSDSSKARRGLRIVAWAGAAYAVLGILSFFIDPSRILWLEKPAYRDSLTATFVNRNTAATYFGSCSVIWLVLLFERIGKSLSPPLLTMNGIVSYFSDSPSRTVVVRLGMMLLCLTALFMTNSRGGILISLLMIAATAWLYLWRGLTIKGHGLMLLGFAASGWFFLQFIFGNIRNRFDTLGVFADEGRLSVYQSIIKMIANNPWLGSGLGTFQANFPAYRRDDISMQNVYDLGHNTFLEFASEVGIPMTTIAGLAWISAGIVLFRAARRRRPGASVALTAFLVSLLAILHSSIDFSLQISGYSIVLFSLLGAGLSQWHEDGKRRLKRREHELGEGSSTS